LQNPSLFLIKKLLNEKRPPTHPDVRIRVGIIEGWVSIIINTLLFGIKIVAGLSINSTALIADAIHTLSDSATSVVVIAGFKLSQKPSDDEHPFGHGRVEPVATLIIAILLFVAGAELFHQAITRVLIPVESIANYYIIAIIAVTAVIKELLARFSFTLGDYIDSSTLKADGLHHRSDVLATLLVVLALVSSRYGFFMIDGIMGCMVALIIFYSAFTIAKDAINPLLGEAPSPALLKKIETLSSEIPGVLGVHDIIVHQYGQNRITSLHIEVSHKKNAFELHMLAEEIEDIIGSITNGIAVVHIDPVNRSHPGYKIIANEIDEIIKKDERIVSFYDLKIIGEKIESGSIIFDITTHDDIKETDNHLIIKDISEKLKLKFPLIRIRIKVNPKFSYNL
jgi:cation diffusion facilitator family transporter